MPVFLAGRLKFLQTVAIPRQWTGRPPQYYLKVAQHTVNVLSNHIPQDALNLFSGLHVPYQNPNPDFCGHQLHLGPPNIKLLVRMLITLNWTMAKSSKRFAYVFQIFLQASRSEIGVHHPLTGIIELYASKSAENLYAAMRNAVQQDWLRQATSQATHPDLWQAMSDSRIAEFRFRGGGS